MQISRSENYEVESEYNFKSDNTYEESYEKAYKYILKQNKINAIYSYLIDNINNSTISMYYTNKSNFPHKIVVIQEGVSMVGYTSEYREDTKDFDIVCYIS